MAGFPQPRGVVRGALVGVARRAWVAQQLKTPLGWGSRAPSALESALTAAEPDAHPVVAVLTLGGTDEVDETLQVRQADALGQLLAGHEVELRLAGPGLAQAAFAGALEGTHAVVLLTDGTPPETQEETAERARTWFRAHGRDDLAEALIVAEAPAEPTPANARELAARTLFTLRAVAVRLAAASSTGEEERNPAEPGAGRGSAQDEGLDPA